MITQGFIRSAVFMLAVGAVLTLDILTCLLYTSDAADE